MRGELLQAWLLGGFSICNARTALHHTLCHCLGARFDVTHGIANAIMLPHVMAFNSEVAEAQLARAGRALGGAGSDASDAQAARGAVDVVRKFQSVLNMPTRLRDVGVPIEGLDALPDDAMHERGTHFNPRKVERQDVLDLYRGAW